MFRSPLPTPKVNDSWPLAGGNIGHDIGHPALGDSLTQAWSASVGDGASRRGGADRIADL